MVIILIIDVPINGYESGNGLGDCASGTLL